jgi:hypothetical protein
MIRMMNIYKNMIKICIFFQHPQLMSGEDPDERKANALKQSLDYIDIFLDKVLISILKNFDQNHYHDNYHKTLQSSYCAGDQLTIADFSILASVTQLEGMDYRITSYPSVSHHISSYLIISHHILNIFLYLNIFVFLLYHCMKSSCTIEGMYYIRSHNSRKYLNCLTDNIF